MRMRGLICAAFLAMLLFMRGPVLAAPQTPKTVDAALSAMSLEEKIGQMMLVAFKGADMSPELADMIASRHIGGVILYSSWGNVENPRQVAALTAAIQAKAAATPRGVGLFIGVDQEGGPINRLREGVTQFPSQMAVAATGDREKARLMARVIAGELAALGINMNFAPVADVNANPANPVIGIRSFGQDPDMVSRLTAAVVGEYNRAGMLSSPKHFPGHGDTDADSHVSLPTVSHDRKTLDRVDLAPFRAAIKAGAPAIMTAHLAVPALDGAGEPATLSPRILQGVLRDEMRFDGLIITDSLGMGALAKSVGTVKAAVMAAKAGADVLLFGADRDFDPSKEIEVYDALVAAARKGEIPLNRIDQAVRRTLAAKERFGLLDAAAIPVRSQDIPFAVGSPENRQAALDIAKASVTLRHDRLKLLPFKKEDRVLLVWPKRAADDPVDALELPEGARLLRVGNEPTAAELHEAVLAASRADKVVVMTYDATKKPAQRDLVRAFLAVKPNGVVHVALGAPYDLSLFPNVPAAVATYGDVPASVTALSMALFGKTAFTGRLPVWLPQ